MTDDMEALILKARIKSQYIIEYERVLDIKIHGLRSWGFSRKEIAEAYNISKLRVDCVIEYDKVLDRDESSD